MPRGRKSVPSMEEVGIWFRHRGMSVQMEKRSTGTTTGVMHHDHLNDSSAHVKRPNVFLKRVETTYKNSNPFSFHDNRNIQQNHGVYFLQNLGKEKIKDNVNLKGDMDIITWRKRKNPAAQNNNSLYRQDFLRSSSGDFARPVHRRFSKKLPEPKRGLIHLPTDTLKFDPINKLAEKDYFQLLADSQYIIKPNPWSYSYHAHSFHELPETGRMILNRRKKLAL